MNKNLYSHKILEPSKYGYIIFFLLCCYICLSLVTCNTFHIPKDNIFINKSNWKRPSYKTLFLPSKYVNLFLHAENFSQGKAVYIEILFVEMLTEDKVKNKKKNKKLDSIYLSIGKKKGLKIILSYMGWGYRGFWGIHPNAKIGNYDLTLRYQYKGSKVQNIYHMNITRTKFSTYRKSKKLSFSKYSNVDQSKRQKIYDFIMSSSKKKKEMFRILNKTTINNIIAHPRNEHFITSKFWTKRVYLKYRIKNKKRVYLKPKISMHRGLDLHGSVGKPIYAMASGKVVIAEKLYFEGNFTLINHGSRIFSGYMHQSKIFVEEGDKVDAGEEIGSVGSTGRATGPHLHIFFKIDGVYVDPLSLISLPIRY